MATTTTAQTSVTTNDGPSTTTDNSKNNDAKIDDTKLRPFEWLTSSQSLKPVMLESIDWKGGHASTKNILNLGCGSSVVGEWLVEDLDYGRILNVDVDDEVIQRMGRRWKNKYSTDEAMQSRNVYECVDVSIRDDEKSQLSSSAAALFSEDTEHPMFDIVLDKSTLDCTLCSATASTGLLRLMYKHLKPGGYYVVVTFHDLHGLMLPLIQDLPGANWQSVTHSELARQVEDLVGNNNAAPILSTVPDTMLSTKTVNIIVCQKAQIDSETNKLLDWDVIQKHIENANNAWYQTINPLLSDERKQQIEQAFVDRLAAGGELELPACYEILFTIPEREHLTYEYFMEDWEAYVVAAAEKGNAIANDAMSLETALDFLQEMQ